MRLFSQAKEQKSIALLFILVFVLCSVSLGKYSGGTGEPNDPYRIATPNDLNSIGLDPNDWDKHFKVIADINMFGYTYTTALIAPDSSTDYGFQGTAFSGVFEGAGYSILNLMFGPSGADYVGLFGCIDSGKVNNLDLENVAISSDDCIGGLVGLNSGEILNCCVTGNINGGDDTGGICGENTGTLVNCAYLGGTVNGYHTVGGLVARNYGNIAYSYATGNVNGYAYTGGLTGLTWGLVEQCFADCIVSGDHLVGGFSGAAGEVSITLLNCYTFGKVEGTDSVGGFVGYIHGATPIAVNCYSAAQVIAPIGCDEDPNCRMGGFVGLIEFIPEPNNCFWDTNLNPDINGIGYVIGSGIDPNVIGLPTSEMQKRSTFADAGWDTVNVWDIGENQTYPFLRKHLPSDINKDNETNFLDMAILAENWLKER